MIEANPQAENGHTDISNEIVEALAKVNLSAYESRILWAIFRQTYGWHKKTDRISITRFQKITGMERRNIARTLNKLIKREIIVRIDNTFIRTYGFQKDYFKWKTVVKRNNDKTVVYSDNTPLSKGTTKSLSESPPIKEKKETILKKEEIPFSLFKGKDQKTYPRVQCRFCRKGYYVKDGHECSEIDLEKLKPEGIA